MSRRPQLSIVIATHNRREVVLNTLARLWELEIVRARGEIIVVDNDSADGTGVAAGGQPGVRLLSLRENGGSCAKALGVEEARGDCVLFLDDDSYPRPGCLERLLAHFAADRGLGAAGFTVHMPDGNQECSALPHVFVGCGVGLRAAALAPGVGNLDRSFFMQAEEYDLSFRLLQAGWKVEIRPDLQVEHLKSPQARRSERTTYHDVRNNLRVIARYLPRRVARIYERDWLQRYRWFAEREGHLAAFERGVAAGRRAAWPEHWAYWRWRLSSDVFEQVFRWQQIERRMRQLYERGLRRVVLADVGKNLYAFARGAGAAGLEVVAIASDDLGGDVRTYRGIGIVTTDAACALPADAWVISNTSYVHAERWQVTLRDRLRCSVHNWFRLPAQGGGHSCRCGAGARPEVGMVRVCQDKARAV